MPGLPSQMKVAVISQPQAATGTLTKKAVKILDKAQMSLSVKNERLIY
jgi:hypothetical protein